MSRAAALAELLRAHPTSDPEEIAHRSRMLALLEAPGDAFARERFEPGHFTASAFVLSPSRDAFLLVHHRKLDRWLQPGGHVDPGDPNMVGAARREAREEVGLPDLVAASAGPFDLDVHDIPARPGEPAHAHFDVRFLFVANALGFTLSSESKAARWVPLSELTGPGVDASVARAASKLLRAES